MPVDSRWSEHVNEVVKIGEGCRHVVDVAKATTLPSLLGAQKCDALPLPKERACPLQGPAGSIVREGPLGPPERVTEN